MSNFDRYSAARPAFGLILEDSHFQIGRVLWAHCSNLCTIPGFLVVQSEIGNAVLPAPIGHCAQLPPNRARGQLSTCEGLGCSVIGIILRIPRCPAVIRDSPDHWLIDRHLSKYSCTFVHFMLALCLFNPRDEEDAV